VSGDLYFDTVQELEKTLMELVIEAREITDNRVRLPEGFQDSEMSSRGFSVISSVRRNGSQTSLSTTTWIWPPEI